MSQGSISVHSLIDKFSNAEGSKSSDTNKKPDKGKRHSPSLREKSLGPSKEELEASGIMSLLGPNVSSFPYSEAAYIEAIKLKAEQERTKQEYYRAEVANRNYLILQTAIRAQVPPNLISFMCVGNNLDPLVKDQLESQIRQQQKPSSTDPTAYASTKTPSQPSQPAPQPPLRTADVREGAARIPTSQQNTPPTSSRVMSSGPSAGLGGLGGLGSASASGSALGGGIGGPLGPQGPSVEYQRDILNASPVPPINYRFGADSSLQSGANRRPLSPAKIGAAAVANLAQPTTPFRSTRSSRRIPHHQRHFSMPTEVSKSKMSEKEEGKLRPPAPPKIVTSGDTGDSSSGASPVSGGASQKLSSPLGATSSIQVKASPAQPLHKQSRSVQQPSQESMQSFQHIIQFHHWKPEGPGTGPNSAPSNYAAPPYRGQQQQQQSQPQQPSHKRHKSENMSVDLTSVREETSRRGSVESQGDITMDTSVGDDKGGQS